MDSAGADVARCRRGHPLSDDNVRVSSRGRACRICYNERRRERRVNAIVANSAAPPFEPGMTIVARVERDGAEQVFDVSERQHRDFWRKVDIPADRSRCWVWTAWVSANGYGGWSINHVKVLAHRAAYQLNGARIPPGMQLDHLCRNRRCVNPAHLEPVTAMENLRRSPYTLTSINAAKTHCPAGHPLAGDNVVIEENGWRKCRTCKNARQRLWYATRGRLIRRARSIGG